MNEEERDKAEEKEGEKEEREKEIVKVIEEGNYRWPAVWFNRYLDELEASLSAEKDRSEGGEREGNKKKEEKQDEADVAQEQKEKEEKDKEIPEVITRYLMDPDTDPHCHAERHPHQ